LIKLAFYSIITDMKELTIGKLRGLQQIASPDGIFNMCAMDHRGSLRKLAGELSYDEMVERKLELCANLAPHASAILLDPAFGAAQCISYGALPKGTGLIVSTEASGYVGASEYRSTELLEDWSVAKIKRMGASAAKLLIYYRPDLIELANKLMDIVEAVGLECQQHDLPFVVEPVVYPIGEEVRNAAHFAKIREQMVLKTAQHIAQLPIDVLKSEFPADLNYEKDKGKLADLCRQLDASSPVPWVVLSAAVDFDTFCRQVEIACRAGASGFLAGRAIWQEAMPIAEVGERVKFLTTVGADRLKKLSEIAAKYATPWYKKLGLTRHKLATVTEGWYQQY
jgi:tagatose 1,6-diphosphate aldolase